MTFEERKEYVLNEYNKLINRKNKPSRFYNGIYTRYENPVLTREHIPPEWKYDFDKNDNPFFMERIGVNATFNSGAILCDGKVKLAVRVEGADRKSFFAIAQSENPTEGFVFDKYPIRLPKGEKEDTNVYDMRLTKHEDGYIYGFFCAESKDRTVNDTSSAVAECGIVRTKDFKSWERLPNLKSEYQQRNVVLHPEFVSGKYMIYTRPSDGFIDVGSGGGIGCAYIKDITNPIAEDEVIIDKRDYHTIKEVKNGAGATPIKTEEGWLHIAHGVRNTAAGLRYVLYCFMTSLDDPTKVIYRPGGYFLAPLGHERVGDVSNVVFSNGAVCDDKENLYIYYASSDTRLHVASTTLKQMIDYCKNTPEDGLDTYSSVDKICELIDKNSK